MGLFGFGRKKEKKKADVVRSLFPTEDEKRAALQNIQSMTDQDSLLAAALNRRYGDNVCLAAAKKLDDAHLAEYLLLASKSTATGALSEEVQELGAGLMERLDADQMTFFLLAMCNDYSFNVLAVHRLTDQELLARVVREHDNGNLAKVRRAAVKKIGDPSILHELVLNDKDPWFLKDALEQIDNQAVLAEVALSDTLWDVRNKAIERLNDPDALYRVAIAPIHEFNAKDAVEKISDQTLLGKIAQEAIRPLARVYAVRKLEDQALLLQIAEQDAEEKVRLAATVKLEDQAAILGILQNDRSNAVKQSAAKHLNDIPILTEVARNTDAVCDVREAAANRIQEIGSESDKMLAEELLADIKRTRDEENERSKELYDLYVRGQNLA